MAQHEHSHRVGRPPISEGLEPGCKTPIRNIRASDGEWLTWQAAARSAGLTLSAWLRSLANRSAKRQLHHPKPQPEDSQPTNAQGE